MFLFREWRCLVNSIIHLHETVQNQPFDSRSTKLLVNSQSCLGDYQPLLFADRRKIYIYHKTFWPTRKKWQKSSQTRYNIQSQATWQSVYLQRQCFFCSYECLHAIPRVAGPAGLAAESKLVRETLCRSHPHVLDEMVRAERQRPETSTMAFLLFHKEDARGCSHAAPCFSFEWTRMDLGMPDFRWSYCSAWARNGARNRRCDCARVRRSNQSSLK